MSEITGAEARDISKDNSKSLYIGTYAHILQDEIKKAARRGHNCICPWHCIHLRKAIPPSEEQKRAIETHFTKLGFNFETDVARNGWLKVTTLSW